MDPQRCPLCLGNSTWLFHRKKTGEEYFRCFDCHLTFLSTEFHLTPEQEYERYKTHRNDVHDEGYQNYLRPVVNSVINTQLMRAEGLDYGCGPNSVASHLLREQGHRIAGYDPFFYNEPKLLEVKYDYIVCTEVIEHFRKPFEEFGKIKRLLRPLGTLFIRTSLTDTVEDFENWHYHRDPTHVCFYATQSLRWICSNLKWTEVDFRPDCCVLQRSA